MPLKIQLTKCLLVIVLTNPHSETDAYCLDLFTTRYRYLE